MAVTGKVLVVGGGVGGMSCAISLRQAGVSVDLIEIEEFGDLSHRPSAHMVMEQMRFGKPLAEFDPERRKNRLTSHRVSKLTWGPAWFLETLKLLAVAISDVLGRSFLLFSRVSR